MFWVKAEQRDRDRTVQCMDVEVKQEGRRWSGSDNYGSSLDMGTWDVWTGMRNVRRGGRGVFKGWVAPVIGAGGLSLWAAALWADLCSQQTTGNWGMELHC